MTTANSFSFSDYANAFRRRLPLFLYVSVPILIITIALSIGIPDSYRSSVRMQVDLRGPQIGTVEPITLTTFADQYANTLERNVLTRQHKLSWLRELNVYPEMAADGATDTDMVDRMSGHIRIEMITTTVIDSRTGRELELIEGFSVGFNHHDPETAQRVAASMAEAFLEADRAIGAEAIDPVLAFLTKQMSDKREQISDLESKIAGFKEANAGKLPDSMNLNMSLLDRAERELEVVRQEKRDLEQNRIFRKAQLDEVRETSAASSELARLEQEYVELVARVGPDHPDLIRVKRQIDALTSSRPGSSASAEIARLESELAVLRESYTEEHPDVARKKREIQQLKQDQASTIDRLRGGSEGDPRFLELKAQVNAIDNQLEGLRSRESELRQRMSDLEVKIAATPQVEREYLAMQRDLDAARETFREVQREYEETALGGRIEEELGARLKQLNNAWLPDEPASPPRLAILIIGAFLAVSLAGMTAIGAEAVDSTVRGSRDIYALLQTQPIGVIPVVHNSVSRAKRRRQMVIMGGSLLLLTALALSISGLMR